MNKRTLLLFLFMGIILSKFSIANTGEHLNETDEVYFEFGGKTSKDLVIKYQNILITRTFSKAFGLASFRIGYVISSGENIKILSKVRNPKNINMLSQIAAISVLDDVSYMKKYVDDVMASKKYFSEELFFYEPNSSLSKILDGLFAL